MLFVSSPSYDDLPPAPGVRGRKRRRRALSREAIVDAALAVLDEGGVDGMNMRAVAERLGTGPASLYAHVSGKDELLALLVDKVSADIALPEIGKAPWQDQVKDAIRGIRRTLGAHRDLARATLGNIPTGPNALRLINATLGVMRDAGLPDQVIAYAVDILPLYATATAYEESLYGVKDLPDEGAAFIAEMRRYFSSLPVDRFPHIVALAVPLTTNESPDARFEFGLDALVRGIASMAVSPPVAGRRGRDS
jgi:AcrR family transcriptional regulator